MIDNLKRRIFNRTVFLLAFSAVLGFVLSDIILLKPYIIVFLIMYPFFISILLHNAIDELNKGFSNIQRGIAMDKEWLDFCCWVKNAQLTDDKVKNASCVGELILMHRKARGIE